jgi:hypothetical protein
MNRRHPVDPAWLAIGGLAGVRTDGEIFRTNWEDGQSLRTKSVAGSGDRQKPGLRRLCITCLKVGLTTPNGKMPRSAFSRRTRHLPTQPLL